jgi:predicted metalloprotease
MRLGDERESGNFEDRRGAGFGGPLVIGGGGLGIVGIVVALLLGVNPADLIEGSQGQPQAVAPAGPRADDPEASFSRKVLASTEDVWGEVLGEKGQTYQPPVLVVYDEITSTACGAGQAAMGPFYCPIDQRVYLDLAFFRELSSRFGATGDFARAYVIAHEVGHHVQNLTGQMGRGGESRSVGAGGGSVRTELQADCYAGVWANHARSRLESGDIEEGLVAARAVGDDFLQKRTQGRIIPDAFTHGTSDQRVRWFTRGYESGRLEDCDTFSAARL